MQTSDWFKICTLIKYNIDIQKMVRDPTLELISLSLSLSPSLPSDQTVFTQCRPSQGVLKHVCTCAPASPSMSGHVIIRTSYHFLGYHSSLCFSPSLPSSQSIVSLPPHRCSPLPPVCPWRTCVWMGTSLLCVHPCTPCVNPADRLRFCALFDLLHFGCFCLASWHMRLKL